MAIKTDFKKGDHDYQNPLNDNFKEIDNGIKNAVSKVANETVLGVKNFSDGLQIGGNSLFGPSYAYITAGDTANTQTIIDFSWSLKKATGDIKLTNNKLIVEKPGMYQLICQLAAYNQTEDNWKAMEVEISNNGAILNYIEPTRTYQKNTSLATVAIVELQVNAQIRVFKNGASTTGTLIRPAVSLIRIA